MKKLIAVFMFSAGISLSAPAQKHYNDEVPAPVKTAFTQQFPGINPRWAKEADQYVAHFRQKRQDISVQYAADGTRTRLEEELKVWQLPLPVIEYMEQHYGDAPKEGAKVTRANGEINYEATVKGREVLFDASCTVLEEETK